MSKFHPRRFICNFVDGTAEFNDDATPPAVEYLSLQEHNELLVELDANLDFAHGECGRWRKDYDRLQRLQNETHVKLALATEAMNLTRARADDYADSFISRPIRDFLDGYLVPDTNTGLSLLCEAMNCIRCIASGTEAAKDAHALGGRIAKYLRTAQSEKDSHTDSRIKPDLSATTLSDTERFKVIGSLRCIDFRAGEILRWIKDPNMHPEVEAKAIVGHAKDALLALGCQVEPLAKTEKDTKV